MVKRARLVWSAVLGLILLVGVFVVVRAGCADVALKLADREIWCGVDTITCTLVNPTLRTITYGETFRLEYRSEAGWREVNDRGVRINFNLGAHHIWPLSSKKIEFPVQLFSDMELPGQYRIVLSARKDTEDLELVCQLTIE